MKNLIFTSDSDAIILSGPLTTTLWCYDTQHNDTHQNDAQHKDTYLNDTKQSDIHQNDI
jgi:hypothetical protein